MLILLNETEDLNLRFSESRFGSQKGRSQVKLRNIIKSSLLENQSWHNIETIPFSFTI